MSYNTGPKIVTDGLVLCLDAADRNSYPGTGTTWYDQSGNGNNGTLTNGPTFTNSNYGVMSFDGVNDYVSVPHNSQLAPTSQISFGSWAYLDNWNINFGTGGRKILAKTESGGYQIAAGETIMGSTYVGGLVFLGGGYRVAKVLKSSISAGWHYLFFSYDGQYFNMYLDGNLVSTYNHGSVSSISYSSNNHFVVGAEPGSGTSIQGNYWNGKIANALVYTKGLSASEVLQNYNATKGRFGL